MLKKALKKTVLLLLWAVHGVHYQSFHDSETGETYYGIENRKDF